MSGEFETLEGEPEVDGIEQEAVPESMAQGRQFLENKMSAIPEKIRDESGEVLAKFSLFMFSEALMFKMGSISYKIVTEMAQNPTSYSQDVDRYLLYGTIAAAALSIVTLRSLWKDVSFNKSKKQTGEKNEQF